MIVGAGVLLVLGADEGQVLDPGHVGGVRARQHAAGKALWIERQQFLGGDQFALQGLKLGVAAVAPDKFSSGCVSLAISSTHTETSRFMEESETCWGAVAMRESFKREPY